MISPVYLLDCNVLIALATPDHSAHTRAMDWFSANVRFATCPITQGALLRFHLRFGNQATINSAIKILEYISESPKHEFWPDDFNYRYLPAKGILGHKQITDAYLAALAASRQSRLATLDEALAALHPAAFLI
jgi:toxin-antitoxin system PIN domain toxin